MIFVVKFSEKVSMWLDGFWLRMLRNVLIKVVVFVSKVRISGIDIYYFLLICCLNLIFKIIDDFYYSYLSFFFVKKVYGDVNKMFFL